MFYLRPHDALDRLIVPTLFIHGTADTFISVESSRSAVRSITGEGAQHGIAVFDDRQYLDPQTRAWQAQVVEAITRWVTRHS